MRKPPPLPWVFLLPFFFGGVAGTWTWLFGCTFPPTDKLIASLLPVCLAVFRLFFPPTGSKKKIQLINVFVRENVF